MTLEITGADDDMEVGQLFARGMLSAADERKLRKLIGAQSFAEWVDDGQQGTYRVTDRRLLLVCVARQRAVADARMLARIAPYALIQEVRS